MLESLRNNPFVHALGKENILFAFRAIITQKLRSFLTLLGIVAGVATVIAMVSFVAGFNEAITGAFSSFGTTLVQFQKFEPRFGGPPELVPEDQRRRRDLTLEDAQALKRLATLAAAVSPERYLGTAGANVTVKNRQGEEANSPMIVGVTPDYLLANNSTLEDGRFFGETDISHASRTCVIGPDLIKALFPGRDPVGREVLMQGVPLNVIGTLEKKGSQMGGSADNIMLIPLSVFDEMFPQIKNGRGDTLHIATVPRDPALVHDMTDQEVAILRQHRGLRAHQPNDFAIFTAEETLQTFQQVTGGIAAAMIFIAGIALLVGGVGIMNIMLVSVTERTREIGVRKALTGVGGAVGIAVGFGVAFFVRFTFDFPAAAPLWSVVLGFGISTAIGLGFGLWPAVKAAQQDPIDALRYE